MVALDLELLPEGPAQIYLGANRSNALVPDLLEKINKALNDAELQGAKSVLISGGRNFCSGGDLSEFSRAIDEGRAAEYATLLVTALQTLVLRLISMPVVVAVAARGAVTGGGAGILFASDMAVASEDVFVQPYYSKVGFAPDGGWLALLPKRIGQSAARAWLTEDKRVRSKELESLELTIATTAADDVQTTAIKRLRSSSITTLLEKKRRFWSNGKIGDVAAGLDYETCSFVRQIATPETQRKLAMFLSQMKRPEDV